MAQRATAQRAWWADVEEVRERIERRRASEREHGSAPRAGGRRTVNITGRPAEHTVALRLVEPPPQPPSGPRRPPRRAIDRIGARPDRIAGWAVLLGIALVIATLLSAHG